MGVVPNTLGTRKPESNTTIEPVYARVLRASICDERSTVIGRCRLCDHQGELRRSHVLPEFLYKPLYDNRHRSVGLKRNTGAKPDILQQGLREYLLCGGCESRLSKYERYGAKILRSLPDTSAEKAGAVVFVRNVEYCKFKIFQMSLIWRAGVTEQPSFGEVKLGPHEPRLRAMLSAGNAGKPWDYPCVLVRFPDRGTIDEVMILPRKFRFVEHCAYSMILWGTIWVFLVSGHSGRIKERRSFLSEDGNLPLHIATESGRSFLAGLARDLRRNSLMGKGTGQ